MDYPSSLCIKIADNFVIKYSERYGGGEKLVDRSINFDVPYTGPDLIHVSVFNNSEASFLDEWLNYENEKLSYRYKDVEDSFLRYVIDKEIKVDSLSGK